MAATTNNEILCYNPASIVGIFNNALTIEITKKAFRVKGIYIAGKGVNYNGFYYDALKDENSDACVTLIVPAMIRNNLLQNKPLNSLLICRRELNLMRAE